MCGRWSDLICSDQTRSLSTVDHLLVRFALHVWSVHPPGKCCPCWLRWSEFLSNKNSGTVLIPRPRSNTAGYENVSASIKRAIATRHRWWHFWSNRKTVACRCLWIATPMPQPGIQDFWHGLPSWWRASTYKPSESFPDSSPPPPSTQSWCPAR